MDKRVTMNEISTIDQLIRMHLLLDPNINSVVDDRIYTDHFMDYDIPTVKMPLIIIENRSGRSNYAMCSQNVEIQIYAYSRISSSQSKEVYDLAYGSLNAARLSQTGIAMKGYMYETERPFSMFNDAMKCWAVRGIYRAVTAG